MEKEKISIVVIPGDGIGSEICACAVEILEEATSSSMLEFAYFPGGAEAYLETGSALPDETYRGCLAADAILHGAAGLPEVVYPDGTEAGQDFSMKIRARLDLFANIRPVRRMLCNGKDDRPTDYVIVRENTEGLYAAREGGNLLQDRVATDTMIITREGTERIARKAADLAMQRGGAPGDGKRRVTIVDKANVLRSYAFFRKVILEVLEDYPGIETECILVDAMAAKMLLHPDSLDVVVTENMFGDILSDLGAATVGGVGIAPSAEFSSQRGYFQSVHGSAPGIAKTGNANPVATILSAAMLLEWVGTRKSKPMLCDAGRNIQAAVNEYLKAGRHLTRDLGGTATSAECTAAIKSYLSIGAG